MPDSYDNLVVGLEARNESELTYNLVKRKLTDEFLKRSERATGGSEQLMLSKNSGRGYMQRKCYICGDPGHLKFNCPKRFEAEQTKTDKKGNFRGSDQENRNSRNDNRANTVLSECNEDSSILLMANSGIFKGGWYIDSGATTHMCRSKEYFGNLKESRSNVVMANGSKVKDFGIGAILTSIEDQNGKRVPVTRILFLKFLSREANQS